MSSPQFDWSFSDAPDDNLTPEAAPPPSPTPQAPRRPWLTVRRRRLILALASLAAVAGLAAWMFTRLGWLRLQSQLAAQVANEDQRALAGDVNAVLAVQAAGQPGWRDQLAADVRLGLAAPLPAGDLRPAGTPPRLSRLDPLGGDFFAATVTRDYVDPSGQTVALDLVQRYTCPNCGAGAGRNFAPGGWERMAPDLSAFAATTSFRGQRIAVQVPTTDLPWLGPALLQADDLIVQACADWGATCPADWRVALAFSAPEWLANPYNSAGEWPRDSGQWTDQSQRPAGLPRIFFLSGTPPPYSLSTPLLTGRPHDAAAQAAFSRSIAVQLLGLFAGEVAGETFGEPGRASNDYFLDALVARVEARHLSAATTPRPNAPQDYVPLKVLWQAAGDGQAERGRRTDLPWRREVFDFLNAALAGQPPAADGRLLRSLRLGGGASLDEWLARGLGSAAGGLTDQWTQQTLAAFAARPATNWSQYDGLLMACGDGLYQVRGGAVQLVLPDSGHTAFTTEALSEVSPDGRYAALATYQASSDSAGTQSTMTDLQVIDLARGSVVGSAGSPWYEAVQIIGWSASNELIFAVHDPQNNQTDSARVLQLFTYLPYGGPPQRLRPDPIDAGTISSGVWSADHTLLFLGLAEEFPRGHFRTVPAVLTLNPPGAVLQLPQVGDSAALSPDGRRVAYIHIANADDQSNATAVLDAGISWLDVLDLTTGSITGLAASNEIGLPQGIQHFASPVWSADGQTFAWMAYPNTPGDYLLSAPAAGGPAHVSTSSAGQLFPDGFSPDGRYLLAVSRQAPLVAPQFWLFDQQAPGVPPPLIGTAASTVWMPGGHRLVIAGPAGLSALDPATGAWEWLGSWQNCQLRW
jgi:hypothetical protein